MANPSLIGVVTVTYNSSSVLPDFMESLLSQTHSNFILYVIDNASSDRTSHELSKCKDSRVKMFPQKINVGVAEGNNIGIREALQDGCISVLLVNNDTVFEADLLSKLDEALQSDGCDMVVPKILFFNEPKRIWSAGGYFSRLRGMSKHFGYLQRDEGQFDDARIVTYGPTCCMLVRREVFKRIGLMDPRYFVYFDDTDFCYRAYRNGVSLRYVPSIRLFHKVSTLVSGSGEEFSIRYCTRNHVYFLLKNIPVFLVPFYLMISQIYIIGKFLIRQHRWATLWVAEKAFWEGLYLCFAKRA